MTIPIAEINEGRFKASAFIQCRICRRVLSNDEVLNHIFIDHRSSFIEVMKERFVMVHVDLEAEKEEQQQQEK